MRLPQTVGSYRLVERLGAGSFGSVYRAEVLGALGFSQDVAVKILDPARAIERPDLIASLADEAVLLSRLQHPNIVQVRGLERIEHDFLGTTYAMVMELVRGIPLRRLIDAAGERGDLIPVQASLLLLSEAADALAYAHDMQDGDGASVGFVHRDMKPGNVLVTREGRLKILDFGIALAADRQVHSTAAGMTKGTVLYMSPEQVRGLPLDGRSDVYSLGLMVFELLTGELFIPLPDGGLADLAGILAAVADVTWADRVPRLREALRAEAPAGHGLSEEQALALERMLEEMLRLQPLERADAPRVVELLDELGRSWQIKRGRRDLRDLVRAEYETYDEVPALRAEAADLALGDPDPTRDGRVPGGPPRPVEQTRILPAPSPVAEQRPPTPSPAPTVSAPRVPRPRRGPSSRALFALAGVLLLVIGVVLLPDDDVQTADGLPPLTAPLPRRTADGDLASGLVLDRGSEEDEAGDPDGDPDDDPEEDEASDVAAQADPDPGGATSVRRRGARTSGTPPARPTRRAARPDPTPSPQVTDPEPMEETPAPPGGRPQVQLIHDPPRFVVLGAPLVLSAMVERVGAGEMCAPRVILAPQSKRKYRRYPMSPAGPDRYAATIDIPYDTQWAEGVRYFMECCWGSECEVRWRGPSAPHLLQPPEF